MKLFIISLGVCVLLTVAQTHARAFRKQQFPEKWGTPFSSKNVQPSDLSRDFMIEGSGKDNIDHTHEDHTHEDDVDFEGISGDKDMITEEPNTYTSAATVTVDNKEGQSVTKETIDDEDMVVGSGSGEESVKDPIVPVDVKHNNLEPLLKEVAVTTPKPLTPCENLRLRSLNLAQFVPECDGDGNFQKMQCRTDKEKHCWCVDQVGTEILGTMFKQPEKPDCEAATKTTQAQTTKLPTTTKTTRTTTAKVASTTARSLPEVNTEDLVVDLGKKNKDTDVIIDDMLDAISKDVIIDKKLDNINKVGDMNKQEVSIDSEPTVHEPILAQPGFLAAIIGSSVVGLLCLILLLMFIVYRMRKKDEGSYPLDDQKYQNYMYSKAPADKELYA